MAKVTPEILANFFDDLENDSSDLETYAAGHPDMAEDLETLVEVAQSVAPPPDLPLQPLARARLRAGLLYEMAQTSRPAGKKREPGIKPTARTVMGSLLGLIPGIERVPAIIAAGSIVAATSFGGGVVFAAEAALPGDTLYSVKLSFENVQVALAPTEEARAEAFVHLAYNRLTDVEMATTTGRVSSVNLAVDSYAQDVSEASQILSQETPSLQTATTLTDRMQTDFALHEGAIAAAEKRASKETTAMLLQADDNAHRALAMAVALNQGRSAMATATASGLPSAAVGRPVRASAASQVNPAIASTPKPVLATAANPPNSGVAVLAPTTGASVRPGATPTPQPPVGPRESPNDKRRPTAPPRDVPMTQRLPSHRLRSPTRSTTIRPFAPHSAQKTH
jgi:hypothetical protein